MEIWAALPQDERSWFLSYAVVPYENVIDIDDKGDEFFEGPHIYATDFVPVQGPFSGWYGMVETAVDRFSAPRTAEPDPATRVEKFPKSYNIDQLKAKLQQGAGIPVPGGDE
jgi:hypothetical protein